MASKRSTLTSKLAAAYLKVAQKADGVEVDYTHQGGTPATIWVQPLDAHVSAPAASGLTTETEIRVFRIPLQTGFDGPSENDEIDWGDDIYVVMDGWTTDKWDALFLVSATKKTTRRAAV